MTLQELSDLNFELAFYVSGAMDLTNESARDLIAAVSELGGGTCYLGKTHAKEGLQVYHLGDKLYNFACDFVLPEFNAEIDKILREYTAEIYHIADKVCDNGGYLVFWK